MLYYTLEHEERSQGKTRKASEVVIKEPSDKNLDSDTEFGQKWIIVREE